MFLEFFVTNPLVKVGFQPIPMLDSLGGQYWYIQLLDGLFLHQVLPAQHLALFGLGHALAQQLLGHGLGQLGLKCGLVHVHLFRSDDVIKIRLRVLVRLICFQETEMIICTDMIKTSNLIRVLETTVQIIKQAFFSTLAKKKLRSNKTQVFADFQKNSGRKSPILGLFYYISPEKNSGNF